MTAKQRVLQRERQRGYEAAKLVQTNAPDMTGTELYAVDDRIPLFKAACAKMNMLERPSGFVCKSSAGRVVRLLQPYDSTIYTQEPEELSAQFGFVWSTDPKKALPFVSISTSPFMSGECCTEDGYVHRSTIDNNVWAPSEYPAGWETVGTIEEVQG